MQREPEEAEVVNDGHDLSEFESEEAVPPPLPSPTQPPLDMAAAAAAAGATDADAVGAKTNAKKRKIPNVLKPKQKPAAAAAARREKRTATTSAGGGGSRQLPKRHRGQETQTTLEVLNKALSDGTIQDIFLRAGISTKTTTAGDLARRIYLSLTKTLLESTLEHTASRRCRTMMLEDVRNAHKSQVGRHLYTFTPTNSADFTNRRPEREKTLRRRREQKRERAAAAVDENK